MASFKNIEKNTSGNASYSAYKKLTSQDVSVTWYVAKKSFTESEGLISLIFKKEEE